MVFILCIFLLGCTKEKASIQDARQLLHRQKDFKEEVLIEKIGDSGGSFVPVSLLSPHGTRKERILFSFIAIYETKDGRNKIVFLSMTQPTRIVWYKEF